MMNYGYDDCGDVAVSSAALYLGAKKEFRDCGLRLFYLKDPLDCFFNPVAIACENIGLAEDACKAVEFVFHVSAMPVRDEKEALVAFRESRAGELKGFKNALSKDFSDWNPRLFEMPVTETKNALLVRREDHDAAVLRLENGKLFLSRLFRREMYDFEKLDIFSENGFPDDPEAWLSGFLPNFVGAREMLLAVDEWRPDFIRNGKFTPEGLFAFFRRFGSHLAGDISIQNFEWLGQRNFDHCMLLYGGRREPEYPLAMRHRYSWSPVFPGQTHGAAADFCGGSWACSGDCAGYYVIPLEQYGRQNMAWRVLSLVCARLAGIPSVDWKPVEIPLKTGGKFSAIAFSRFDLRAGKPVHRIQLANLPDHERGRVLAALSEKDRANLAGRFLLGNLMGFSGMNATIIEARPQAYLWNEMELSGGERNFVSLGDFAGSSRIQGRHDFPLPEELGVADAVLREWKETLHDPGFWGIACRYMANACPLLEREAGICEKTAMAAI